MFPVFIYALLDPQTGIARYVGQTENPDRRLKSHIRDARKRLCHSACWLKMLSKAGRVPIMEILDVVPDSEADFWEIEYIQNFRERGFDLTNMADGGSTTRGVKFSQESCERISVNNRKEKNPFFGKKHSPETHVKMSLAQKGNKNNLGKRHSTETREKMSASKKGNKHCLGRCLSPETRAKMSAARKKFWADKNK